MSEKNHSFLYSKVTSSKAWMQQLKKLDLQMQMKPVKQEVIVYQTTEAWDLEYKE